MGKQHPLLLLAALSLTAAIPATHPTQDQSEGSRSDRGAEPRDASAYRWFSVPIEVTALPGRASFVVVTCHVDFSACMRKLGVAGVADTHSLRLSRLGPDGSESEEPVQFTASPQPRPEKRATLPDTPPNVSYLGEYRAGVTPEGIKVAGELTWVARADGNAAGQADRGGREPAADRTTPATARYRLEFATLREGTVVQAPYPPQDLHVFDAQGRPTPVRQFPRMQVRPPRPSDGQVHLFDAEQLVASYHLGPAAGQAASPPIPPAAGATFRRPFLYPVIGPDGIPLTGFGKPHDPTGSHDHHYSLWVAHASVNGKDFWSEKGGAIVHDQLESVEDGSVFCRLVQRANWLADGTELLHERRRVTLYRTPNAFRAIDIDLELSPAGRQDVKLGKTSFGFLAARVAESMSVFDGGGEILNANGDRNERGAHLKRADWIDQSGPVAPERWGGIALLDHPDNPNHPTAWHCRNDGWAGAAFNADASHTIHPGQPLRLRYRVLLHRGDAAAGRVADHYADYAARPMVRLGDPTPLQRAAVPATAPAGQVDSGVTDAGLAR